MSKEKMILDANKGKFETLSSSRGHGEWGLSVAKVIRVDEAEQRISVHIMSGEADRREPLSIPMNYPFAGRRSILGGLPQEGDFCIVGNLLQESISGARTPVILSWFSATSWMGQDWVMGSDLSDTEGMATPDQRSLVEGNYSRVRFKLGHLNSGNIFGSSAQGSDFVLSESVHLANRRGNEFILRDSDQTAVTRAIASHDALAGLRVYQGPVMRVGDTLSTQMFSDGLNWESSTQLDPDTGLPITRDYLELHSGGPLSADDIEAPEIPGGYLKPSYLFYKVDEDGVTAFQEDTGFAFDEDIDPNQFLLWGGFITSTGYRNSPEPEIVYGGRTLYRVGLDDLGRVSNAAGDAEVSAFTEHRIEIQHVSDLTLPVTEITDSLDIDRLPSEPATGDYRANYMEIVHGTVIGNDPYSQAGNPLYRKPITFTLFEGEAPSALFGDGEAADLGDHLASLYRLSPPSTGNTGDTIFTVSKSGSMSMLIGGTASAENSLEIHARNGILLSTEKKLVFSAEQGFEFRGGRNESGAGLDVASNSGGVRIFGGGILTEGTQVPGSENVNLLLEGESFVKMRAAETVAIEAPAITLRNANAISVQALTALVLQAGDSVQQSSKTYDRTTTGKSTEVFGGPIDGLITNGPVRDIKIIANPATGFIAGVNDQYQNIYGDREETFLLGSHTTQCVVGNLTYSTLVGVVTQRAGVNQTELSLAGQINTIAVGNITTTVAAGTIVEQSTVSSIYKTTGAMTVSGTASLLLGGPGKVGPIVCGSDLDPLTGLPLIGLGMGSPGHILITPV